MSLLEASRLRTSFPRTELVVVQGNDSESNHRTFDKARFSYFLSKGITMSMRGEEML